MVRTELFSSLERFRHRMCLFFLCEKNAARSELEARVRLIRRKIVG